MIGLLFGLLRLLFWRPRKKRHDPPKATAPVYYVAGGGPDDPRLKALPALHQQQHPSVSRPSAVRRALGPGAGLVVGLLLLVALTAACSRILDATEPVRDFPETLVTVADAVPALEDLPGADAVAYLRRVLEVVGTASRIVADSHTVNRAWDNRSETGATSAETRAAFDELDNRAQDLLSQVEGLDAPSVPGLGGLHTAMTEAVARMAGASTEASAGFRSSDTGQRRQVALDEIVDAFGDLNGIVDRVRALIDSDDGDPADWLPSNDDYLCRYTALWVVTKTRWGLSIDPAEATALGELLDGPCPGLAVVHAASDG